ncbi:hypothetical protein PENSOL_c044G00687 [Penicillium solitum]|uniref:Telomere replication protein EST3 n=1 Tax=Penicillium solitum TaxID=60172 RepID=A0A1V6QSE0_9EURO|nr:uncharacterized protein PENSOL_c044G00687 [Penicillium solitum]OQD92140.1 hypothetical protein PENSOL_c044G00687 [Penicillium solitum]
MDPVSPWIAALADQCLSFYLGQNDQDEVQVEDVDGCLSFSIRSPVPKAATVVLWEQGEHSHRATLTDTMNQVDAIISRDSLDTQGETSPCPPSIKGGPRHLVELSDIKLIFTYSAASPDVCLHINRIAIHRNAVPKGDVPKPKLRKAAALRALMTMVCERIRKTRGHAGSNSQTTTGLADSFVSHPDKTMPHSQTNSTSQLLFSQPPPNMRHGAPKGNSMANRVSINGSSDLLGLLAPAHSVKVKETATKINNTADATHTSKSPTYVTREEVDNFIAECRNQVEQSPNQSDDHGQAHTIETVENQQVSKKRNRGSTDAASPAAHDDGPQGRQTPKTSPSKKRQRIDAREVMSADPTGFEQVQTKPVPSLSNVGVINTKPDIVCPFTANPWDGMTKIPLSEVDIPKDQAELLEGLKWIPQDPGVSAPLCHVPPHLLTQWNKVARRRQPLAEEAEEEEAEEEEAEAEAEAEEEEQVSECAPTPTPQDPYTSPLPWSPSPHRSPARDVLPRDTASPPTFVRPTRKITTPSSTQYSIDRSAEDGDVSMVNASCSAPQPGEEDINTADQQRSPSLEEVPTNPRNSESVDHDPGDDPSQNHESSTSLDVVDDQPESLIQEHSHDEPPVENPPLKSEMRDESSSDESDEPEMETYVPFALGGSLPLSSQPEQELPSSGPSLPIFAGGTIQVVETPAVHTTRLNPDKKSKQRAGLQPLSSQQPYYQAPKTSPSSRILNTYRSQDSNGHSYLSQEAPNPSLPVLEDESLRVDVLGTQTQTSSVLAPSQATVQSSSDVVLDSSRPAQRQRGSSIFHLDPSDDPSSFPYAGCHSLPGSQLHEPSQDSSRGPFSLDGASQLPELSPVEFTTWVAAQGESPSKSSRPPLPERADAGQKASHSPNVELVARRQGFIGKSDKYAEAQTIYEKFCSDYSPYSGDFAHFTGMCSKLQTMRQKGQLQRSFLWDDFVIQHLEEYPRYFADLSSQESKALQYEHWFCSRFFRPQHKKRSLTAHGVDIVASQFVPPTSAELENPPVPHQATIQSEVTQDKVVQSEVRNTSFTASLVEEIPTLHPQSFDDVPAPDGSMPTATPSSSSSSASTGSDSVEVKQEPDDSFNEPIAPQIITSSNDQKPVPSSHEEEMVDATQYDADNTRIVPDANDVDMTEPDMDEIDETQEGDDTHHETASIELGDDTDDRRLSASPAPPAALGMNAAEPEPSRQRRPWFRSLREIFPKGPVWSDDPDTPFKRWARQDQNVLQELRRRGGARVLTDEKGVIRWPTSNQEKNPDP